MATWIGCLQRAKAEARLALADQAEPSLGWNPGEQKAWTAVLEIADTAAPLSFAELAVRKETEDPLHYQRDATCAFSVSSETQRAMTFAIPNSTYGLNAPSHPPGNPFVVGSGSRGANRCPDGGPVGVCIVKT